MKPVSETGFILAVSLSFVNISADLCILNALFLGAALLFSGERGANHSQTAMV
jgi:hypothetical protein